MAREKTLPTIEEILALLERSSLPTVIIEGADDVVVYRRMEERFYESGLSVLPVGGRANVLKIFDELIGMRSRENLIFIADRDLWVISSIPDSYIAKNLIFTDGYSIENDVFRDLNVGNVMSADERRNFHREVDRFVYWYSLMVKRMLEGEMDTDLGIFPSRILDDALEYDARTRLKEEEVYPGDLLRLIEGDKEKYVRGKSLMHIASRQLSRPGRDQKIPTGSLMGIAPAVPGPLLSRIFDSVSDLIVAKRILM